MPTYIKPLTANLGSTHTGLVGTLGYTITDAAGATLVARTTSGITEDGSSGIYNASATVNYTWIGRIKWDAGAGTLAEEDLLPRDVLTTDGSASGEVTALRTVTLTATIKHYGAGGMAVSKTIDAGTATLTLKQGATIVFGPAEALITPAGAATSHVLSYILPGTDAVPDGTYTAQWDRTEGGIAQPPAISTVVISSGGDAYPAISAWAQSKLQEASLSSFYAAYPAYALEAAVIVESLLLDRPCIGAYADLTGNDKVFFDKAAGLLLAAVLKGDKMAGMNNGQGVVSREKAGDIEKEYAATTTTERLGLSVSAQWANEALGYFDGGVWHRGVIEQIACIRAVWASATSTTISGMMTRTRAADYRFPAAGASPWLHTRIYTYLGSYGIFDTWTGL